VAAKKRARAARRERDRILKKLGDQREKLARLEAGGSAKNPLAVSSASQIEPRAENEPCLRCGERVRVSEHAARTLDGARLRVVVTTCPKCGARRTLYFRISEPLEN
jgi:ribosomal protein S27AE